MRHLGVNKRGVSVWVTDLAPQLQGQVDLHLLRAEEYSGLAPPLQNDTPDGAGEPYFGSPAGECQQLYCPNAKLTTQRQGLHINRRRSLTAYSNLTVVQAMIVSLFIFVALPMCLIGPDTFLGLPVPPVVSVQGGQGKGLQKWLPALGECVRHFSYTCLCLYWFSWVGLKCVHLRILVCTAGKSKSPGANVAWQDCGEAAEQVLLHCGAVLLRCPPDVSKPGEMEKSWHRIKTQQMNTESCENKGFMSQTYNSLWCNYWSLVNGKRMNI